MPHLPLALTLGEPAGIGPDITLAIWRRRVELDLPPFYLIGDPEFLARARALLGLDVPLAEVAPAQAAAAFARALPVVPLGLPVTAAPGKPDASSAPAAIASIRRAVADVLAGRAAGGRHQSDRQERALPLRLCRARPHRISRAGSPRKRPASGARR